jgi:hypothetical protein
MTMLAPIVISVAIEGNGRPRDEASTLKNTINAPQWESSSWDTILRPRNELDIDIDRLVDAIQPAVGARDTLGVTRLVAKNLSVTIALRTLSPEEGASCVSQ